MNDNQIRLAFHETILHKRHRSSGTLIVDELGLEHGARRADIAVINGHLIGYEIKSDVDSLKRLTAQVASYDAVFDSSTIILTKHHLNAAIQIVPKWWGVLLAEEGKQSNIRFSFVKRPARNHNTNIFSIAQLLWRNEAQEVLMNLGIRGVALRKNRNLLYQDIISILTPTELKSTVREYLKKRRGWRDRYLQPSQNGDLFPLREIEIDCLG